MSCRTLSCTPLALTLILAKTLASTLTSAVV